MKWNAPKVKRLTRKLNSNKSKNYLSEPTERRYTRYLQKAEKLHNQKYTSLIEKETRRERLNA
jgi:hypothetical protein